MCSVPRNGASSAFGSGVANALSIALTAVPAITASSWPGGKQWTLGLPGKKGAGFRQSHPALWSCAGLGPLAWAAVTATAEITTTTITTRRRTFDPPFTYRVGVTRCFDRTGLA